MVYNRHEEYTTQPAHCSRRAVVNKEKTGRLPEDSHKPHFLPADKKNQEKQHPYMPRNRSSRRKTAHTASKIKHSGKTSSGQIQLADQVLAFLSSLKKGASLAHILSALELPRTQRQTVRDLLDSLVRSGKLEQQGKKFRLASDAGLLTATLDVTARGFGFATVEDTKPREKDIFIAQSHMNGASHGDTVLIRIIGKSRGRLEGRVVKVVKRGLTRLCGVYTAAGKVGHVTPDNEKLPFTVTVRRSNAHGARDGEAVLLQIIDYGSGSHPPEGKVLEVLGDPLSVPVQIRMAIEQFELDRTFPREVLAATAALEPLTTCDEGRADLRHIQHVTIDGETAKDFDDAIAVEETANGYRLYVSIADVSHYVTPGSTIDKEAYKRGTSVYLPDQVLPMLPERLSNDLCSLVPEQDRPAFTAILDFDREGNRIAEKYTKSMIHSHQRFTYNTVNAILYLRDNQLRNQYRHLLPMLDNAKRLATLLYDRRMRRGSLGFNIPEPFILLDGDKIVSITRAERNQAHQLIEEYMLAANEAVAQTMAEAGEPVLYRVHEYPDPAKVEQFTEAAQSLGLELPKTSNEPAWFARILDEAHKSPAEYVINNLLLRTMQQARYSPDNLGHFGLAAEYYLHFTSPIRRYPDLVAHRALQHLLTRKKGERKKPLVPKGTTLADAALYLSKRERIAVNIERNVQSRLNVLFLKDRVGETFDAIISGVTAFGLFVELLEYFISGAVPVREMQNDYYIHDSRANRLIGERTGITYQLGDLLRVRLDHMDMQAKRLTFSISAEPADTTNGQAD